MSREPGGCEDAWIVLEHLDFESEARLLAIETGDLGRLYRGVDAHAAEVLDRRDLAERERFHEVTAAASEGRCHPSLAAALCALAHDRDLADETPQARYVRAVLRWQLGHALFLMAEDDPEKVRRCLRGVRQALRQTERLWRAEGISKNSFYSLIYELQNWIGSRHDELGEYQAAAEAFSEAGMAARTVDNRVACNAGMATAMAKLGEVQRAYELLLLAEDDLSKVEDEEIRELWEGCRAQLSFELGGDPKARGRRIESRLFDGLSHATNEMLEGDVPSVKDSSILAVVASFQEMLAQAPEDDLLSRHELSTTLAPLLFSLNRDDEAEDLLRQAESLEEALGEELPRVERKMVLARRQVQLREVQKARSLFTELRPAVERLMDDGEQLAFLTEFLVCLISEDEPEGDLALELSRRGLVLFEQLLRTQPAAAGRRRVRDIHQRFFEAALLALLSSVQQIGEDSESGQALLAASWTLALVGRNPELRTAKPALEEDVLRHLREKEGLFHGVLRAQLLHGDPADSEAWCGSLNELSELEMMHVPAPRFSEEAAIAPPAQGVALALFEVRDLSRTSALICLGSYQGRFTSRLLAREDYEVLIADVKGFGEVSEPEIQPVSEPAAVPASPADGNTKAPLYRLLPRHFAFLPARRFARSQGQEPSPGAPLFPVPWFLFLDRPLSDLPLEMLGERLDHSACFGESRSVQLCLRPTVQREVVEPVDFSKGWLGVGGVPAAGPYKDHPGLLKEVTCLEAFLQGCGHPTRLLKGERATASELQSCLLTQRPSVLHFSAHGYANSQDPEACALVLANDPDRPEGELLPFRRIRELDLSGIGLVVLSACESFVGRSRRGGGIEGLVWAFLQAGAAQVIASRSLARDQETASFMSVLYRHLQGHSVAEALGLSRHQCLNELGMHPYDVATWSVWS